MVQVGSQKYGGYFKLFFTFTSHLYPNVTKYSQFCYIILWEELTKFDSEEIDESWKIQIKILYIFAYLLKLNLESDKNFNF